MISILLNTGSHNKVPFESHKRKGKRKSIWWSWRIYEVMHEAGADECVVLRQDL